MLKEDYAVLVRVLSLHWKTNRDPSVRPDVAPRKGIQPTKHLRDSYRIGQHGPVWGATLLDPPTLHSSTDTRGPLALVNIVKGDRHPMLHPRYHSCLWPEHCDSRDPGTADRTCGPCQLHQEANT